MVRMTLWERKLEFDTKCEDNCELMKVLKCVDGVREGIYRKVACARIAVSSLILTNQHRLEL